MGGPGYYSKIIRSGLQQDLPFFIPAPDEDDDVLLVETEEGSAGNADDTESTNRKRKLEDKEHAGMKRMRSEPPVGEQEDVIALD